MLDSATQLLADLRAASGPDRRLDSRVTAFALAPLRARLDEIAGIDGWDIVTPVAGRRDKVWRAADEVLYVTQFVDSAIELCRQASPRTAPAAIRRALTAVLEGAVTDATGEDMGSLVARHILAEMVEDLSMASTAPREVRVRPE